MDQFRHTPLSAPLSEIRLLEIQHEPDTETIKCRIFHCPLLDNTPTYAAVSYTWGDSNNDQIIHNKNESSDTYRTVNIDHNFWRALQELRSIQLAIPCWIDAICIDQSSTAVKSKQITLMGHIYSRAQNVFISISIGDAHERLGAFHPTEQKLSKSQRLTITQILQEISRHPYWERLWILQEVFCARNICLLSNGSSVPLNALYDIGLRFEHSLRGTSVYEILRLMREAISTGLPRHSMLTSQIQRPLRELLSRFGDQKCKEPHDIVYGLYAMMLAPERETMGIDYDSNLETFLMSILPFLQERRSPLSNVEMSFTRRLFNQIPILQTVQASTTFPAEFWLETIDYQIFARKGCACAYAEDTTHILHFAKSHWAPPMQALCRKAGSDLTLLRIDTRTDDPKLKCSRHKRDDECTWIVQFRRDNYLKLLLAGAGGEDLWTVEMAGSCAHVHPG